MTLSPSVGWLLTPSGKSVRFAARNTAASMVALWLGFYFQLDSPTWGAATVWIVAQPTRGMSLAKGRWRAVGTVIGAVMALILVGAFAQTPELFILALALWTGACTLTATVLRSFRTYAAVLAAYTAAIIALGSVANPDGVFDLAVARASYILMGVAVEAVFSALFSIRGSHAALRAQVAQAITDAARMSAMLLRTGDNQAHHGLHPLAATITLETQIEFAVAEMPGLSVVANDVRAMVVNLLTLLSAAQGAGELRRAGIGGSPALAPLVERTARLLDAIGPDIRSTAPALRLQADPLREALEAAVPADGEGRTPRALEERALLDRMDDMVVATAECLDHEIAVVTRHPVGGPAALAPPVDWGAAMRNGLRAVIGVIAGGTIWIATAWPDGGSFVTDVVVICSLFGTLDNPVIGALSFLEGGLLAILAAFILLALLLPLISGFPLLVLMLAPFLMVGGLAMTVPRFAGPATGFTIFTLTLIGLDNSTRTNPLVLFNGSIALVLGILLGAVVFRVVLPVTRVALGRQMQRGVTRDLRSIARMGGNKAWLPYRRGLWSARMADRVARLVVWAAGTTSPRIEAGFAGLAASIGMGRRMLRLREHLMLHTLPREGEAAVTLALRRLTALARAPDRAASASRLAGERLAHLAAVAGATQARPLARAASDLLKIAGTIEAQREFFQA